MMLLNLKTLAAIELASPWMLGWLAAAALPWLINLWSRRRHVETSWAAVELLMAAVRERSRRLRLRELLLLALRTSILLLVALAAARPAWRPAAGAATPAERTHQVIVIDQSFSMATEYEGASRLQRAQAAARQIVNDAATGDAFSVVAWSDATDDVLGRPTFDASAVLAAIDSLEPADTVARLEVANRAVHAAGLQTKERFPGLTQTRVTFISDLGLNTWSAAIKKGELGDESQDGLPPGSRIESVADGVASNLAIADVYTEPALPVLNEPLTVLVELKPFGRHEQLSASVDLLLDGNRLGQQQASLSDSSVTILRFETRLVEPGTHVFEARLPEGVDALAVDNRRWLATKATDGPNVLCVTDNEGGADDVARALNPRFEQAAASDAISVDIVVTSSLTRADVSAYDAIFLANVAELLPREQRVLQRYVAEGGSLAIILGDRTKPVEFNSWLQVEPPLSPVEIGDQPVEGDWGLDPLGYRHPILEPFAGRSRSGLLSAGVSKYYPLRLRDDSRAAVALAFNTGDPALVVNEHGRGRVAMLATNPALSTEGEPWSTLAVSPAFVPLVRELFTHLSADRRTSQLNYLAGESIEALSPTQARTQGVHQVGEQSIAVNVDISESDLTAVNASDLQTNDAAAEAHAFAAPLCGAGSTPLAGYLLAAAAVLMLIELTTAWLLGRGWA